MTRINIHAINGVPVKKEIPNDFIICRVRYLCRKGIALISNDEYLFNILNKILMLTNIYDISDSQMLKKEIDALIFLVNQYIEEDKFCSPKRLNILKTICKLYQAYGISDDDLLVSINNNIERVKNNKKSIKVLSVFDNSRLESNPELDEVIEKLYYEKVYEIVLEMERQIGNASDTDIFKWVFDYVFGLRYASIPAGCASRIDGVTLYDSSRLSKKITSSGKMVPLNSSEEGKIFDGIFSKYNLVFSNEREGLCGAKNALVEDLCDFALNKKNFCVCVRGIHMNVMHGWNALINSNGVYHFDASCNWHGKKNQYFTAESDLERKWPDYSTGGVVYNVNAFSNTTVVNNNSEEQGVRRSK